MIILKNNMEHSVILQLKNITKTYDSRTDRGNVLVLNDVSLTLKHGELLGLLGPSGCGKTTLLRIMDGIESISQGTEGIAGRVVSTNSEALAAEKRNTGMVFQDYALFPHLTVEDNIAFGLKNQGKKHLKSVLSDKKKHNKQIKQRVEQVLELVGLLDLRNRYPHQLSGGQQQRISLARALAPQPALILLDEPLSNLDVQVRQRLRTEIRSILKAVGTSAIFVTHDREEALAISDKIAVMRSGKIEQIGTPEEIYLNPQSRFVGEFVTQANFLPAIRKDRSWITELGEVKISKDLAQITTQQGEMMLRLEDSILTPDRTSTAEMRDRQFLGKEYHYCVETASGKSINARTDLNNAIAVGTKVSLSLNIDTPKIFPFSAKDNKSLAKVRAT